MLIVHGAEDRILPFESVSQRRPALVEDARLVSFESGTAQHRVNPS